MFNLVYFLLLAILNMIIAENNNFVWYFELDYNLHLYTESTLAFCIASLKVFHNVITLITHTYDVIIPI